MQGQALLATLAKGGVSSEMAITVRPANGGRDRDLLTGLLSRNLSPHLVEQRFDWLYQENPHGPASVWLAQDDETHAAIGCAAVFPRQLWVSGAIQLGYVLGDFCTDVQHRSLGLALKLQRACLNYVSAHSPALAYDFPSDRMMAIYQRLKILPFGRIVRWAKLLRADRKIQSLVKFPGLGGILAAPVNLLLKWKDHASADSKRSWRITEHEAEFGDEFTSLAEEIGSRYGTCIHRSANYMNWRYRRHPSRQYRVLVARRDAKLVGYVVFSHTVQDAVIVECFGLDETSMWNSLLKRVLELLRKTKVTAVSLPLLDVHPWSRTLGGLGFRPRESNPVVIYEPGKTASPQTAGNSGWFLMDGDRES